MPPNPIYPLTLGSAEAYKDHFPAQGRREGQFKPLSLQYARNLEMDLRPWTLSI